jgi:cytochrome P450
MQTAAPTPAWNVPPHVPPELVIPFDFSSDPRFKSEPFEVLREVSAGARIFFTPVHFQRTAGSWVLTRAEDIRYVLTNPELFSSFNDAHFSAMIGESWVLSPIEIDPPLHGVLRRFLDPLFAPNKVKAFEADIATAAGKLIEALAPRGHCDFIGEFAKPFPVSIFLSIMGMPIEKLFEFVSWAKDALLVHDPERMRAAVKSIADYLRQQIALRREHATEDLISKVLLIDMGGGRKISDDEALGLCFLLFLAGVDTVTVSMGFHYHFLATHPEVQAQLRADRSLLPAAIEELLRLHGIPNLGRTATRDLEIAGVGIRKGDWITIPTSNANIDATEFENPRSYEPNRANTRHVTFGFGIHRCLGSNLARREMVVAMNAWFDRIPTFGVTPGTRLETHGGSVFGVTKLDLSWDPQRG